MDPLDVEEYADVFAALSDESRLEILVELCRETWPDGPLGFTETMAAAEFEDSGRFNYHLERLRENFVFRREEAYLPTVAALELFVEMRTGLLADNDLDVRRASLNTACLGCGRQLVAEYQYEFYVWCPRCERGTGFVYPVGPDVAGDADLQRLAHELDRTDRAHTRAMLEHRCPRCGGETRVGFWDEPSLSPELDVTAFAGCTNCGHGVRYRSVGGTLLCLPGVQDYCREHGIDLHDRPQWAYYWARTGASTVVRSKDPWQIEQYAHVDGCRLRAEVADDGSVEAIDHVPIDGSAATPQPDRYA